MPKICEAWCYVQWGTWGWFSVLIKGCDMLMNNSNMGQNIAKSDRGPDKKGKLYHIFGGFMEKVSSCPTLCDSMACSLPGSSVHGIFPGTNTKVGCHFLLQGNLSFPTQDWTCLSCVSCFGGQILYHWATWEAKVNYRWLWRVGGGLTGANRRM